MRKGSSVTELTGDLAKRLSKYIPYPVVMVTLQEIPGDRVYILWRVNKPGDFLIARGVEVMQALAMAGGLISFADRKSIKVLRRKDGKQVPIPITIRNARSIRRTRSRTPFFSRFAVTGLGSPLPSGRSWPVSAIPVVHVTNGEVS